MSVYFEEFGDPDEKTLIFVHGAGGSSATWFMQLRGLSNDYNVVAIDLNGHGKTTDRNEHDTMQSYLDDINEVVSKYDNPFLGGHSMGGALAQLFALEYPNQIAGLILIGTGSRLRVLPLIFDMLENNFEGYVEAAATFMFDESTSQNIVNASQAEIRKCKPSIISRDFHACNKFDIMSDVSSIKMPTLILVGENDQMTPVKYSKYINDMISNSTLHILPNAGHSVMLEQADAVNQIIREWISSLNG